MDDFKKGEWIIIKDPCWWEGKNYGGCGGKIIDLKGHILVEAQDGVIVKCFRYEIQAISSETEADKLFEELFPDSEREDC